VKQLSFVLIVLLAGCTSVSSMNWKPADAAQTTPPPVSDESTVPGKPKVKQWFTTDTPETLPKEKLEKMNIGGFGGY
jgi:hypothetical protein